MDDLAAFLAARYDEEQSILDADAADTGLRYADADPTTEQLLATFADETRCRRDIALKRAILAEHEHVREDHCWSGRTDLEDGRFGCSTCDSDSEYGQGNGGWCATVRHLGTEFSDRQDYKQAWRPT